MSDFKKCKAIEHQNIQSGWGCCMCRTFNGNQRTECKTEGCAHKRCDLEPKNKPS